MAEKYEPHPAVKKAHRLLEEGKKSYETKLFQMQRAYISAAEKYLIKDGEFHPDYSLLKKGDVQKNMSEEIVKHLVSVYENESGISEKDIKLEGIADRVFQLYYGFDKDELNNMFSQHKDKLTLETYFSEFANPVAGQTLKENNQYALAKVNREHLDDIIKYVKLNPKEINRDKITDYDLKNLLSNYVLEEKVPRDWFEKQNYYQKPEEKDKKKDGKKEEKKDDGKKKEEKKKSNDNKKLRVGFTSSSTGDIGLKPKFNEPNENYTKKKKDEDDN